MFVIDIILKPKSIKPKDYIEEINLKIIKKHLQQTSEDFLNIFPEEMQEKLRGNFYFAGGCIYSLYNGGEPNDYDIFITNENTVNDIMCYFIKYIEKFKHNSIARGILDNGFPIVKTKFAITINNKYQIIHRYIGEPTRVVEEFDFKHNMFYYIPDKKLLGRHPRVKQVYLSTKEMYFNDFRCRDLCGVILRLPKFISRGMSISKKEIAKILTKLQTCINNDNEKEILLDYTSTQGY